MRLKCRFKESLPLGDEFESLTTVWTQCESLRHETNQDATALYRQHTVNGPRVSRNGDDAKAKELAPATL
jgi:hypothetical protein